MKQKITLLILAVFTSVISAQTVAIQGGSSYGTIQEAIDASVDGDVILITGVFIEPITISNKSITLRGTDPTTDIIQAAASASSDGLGSRVITLSASSTVPDPLPVLNITIENLGVRYGNANGSSNGGGIFSDKIKGLVTLKNLIIENNYTARHGGGLSFDGSNANIIECTLRNNTSATDGGGIIIAPNSAAAINCIINIQQSLLDSNTGRNGGGIWINGANTANYTVNLNIENSTISNNTATSPSTGNGGGAILSTSPNNVTLSLVHATVFNNTHAGEIKSGLQFLGTSTNFSAYNSIIVGASNDELTKRAINFANTNTTSIVNCIIGATNAPPALISNAQSLTDNNILVGRTASESGLDIASGLQSLGGNTQVFAILDKSGFAATTADDYCTTATGITLPTIDQRGYTREGVQDAGAFEVGATLGLGDDTYVNNSVRIYPNPATDYLMVSKELLNNHYGIYDITGKLVKNGIITSEKIDINLNSGLYLFKVETDLSSITKKIIVK